MSGSSASSSRPSSKPPTSKNEPPAQRVQTPLRAALTPTTAAASSAPSAPKVVSLSVPAAEAVSDEPEVTQQAPVSEPVVEPLPSLEHLLTEASGISPGPLLVEIAWEVARRVGGIYTVIRSKVPFISGVWKDRYCLVGIYHHLSAQTEFEEIEAPPLYQHVLDRLRTVHGIRVHFGNWLIPTNPKVFLLELNSSEEYLIQWRTELMPGFDRPDDDETNKYIIFGYQVAALLQELGITGRKIIGQFHEWQSGAGLVVARRRNAPNLATVFTTHATLLGRYMCAARLDLYNIVQYIDTDKEAGDRGIYHRHWLEKEAAHLSHIFTTVSEITAYESQHILKRRVDYVTPNGLNVEKFTALHEFQNLHALYKEKIMSFIRGHFYGYYDFDLDKTLYFFTAGRYEYYNKGIDLFLDSLNFLNHLLKTSGSDVTVVAFIITPTRTNNFNVDSLKGQSLIRELKANCDQILSKAGDNLFDMVMRGNIPHELPVSRDDEIKLKRQLLVVKSRNSLPPITTHNVLDDGNDEVLNHIRRIQLFNYPYDRVKIIFHPEFLSSTSPLLPLDYDQFVRGCHLGVFPSYYEPWGYTPAECTVMGVPSISSNLTGFANFMNQRIDNPDENGIYTVDRRYRSYSASVEQAGHIMRHFCEMSRRERIQQRNRTERLSDVLDWQQLGVNYLNAYKHAFWNKFLQPLEL